MKTDVQGSFPNVTKTLIKNLEEAFPKRDFTTEKTLRELDYHYGQRSVVNFLKQKLIEQTERIL
tara:strand:- start:222 stop:413 length:192 start_codon:yes stop_codon:yes gene_type:complete